MTLFVNKKRKIKYVLIFAAVLATCMVYGIKEASSQIVFGSQGSNQSTVTCTESSKSCKTADPGIINYGDDEYSISPSGTVGSLEKQEEKTIEPLLDKPASQESRPVFNHKTAKKYIEEAGKAHPKKD